ncbi:TetR/AcrR family transcriptional regulator [Nocardia sp. alder85J]|uniref:TetR/AcrR family transcriptional regulator n=1 Tax=Nocardia sp. alder85J TaxID=2862949 RepID=UPI001CD1EB76|nr:TetR/AcrR family transcriptional regulator [Nocardia sp. alder85J]MCX4098191.1 TetR/AcrR family transcriptional regulator [Nocardia sp. alder85J]
MESARTDAKRNREQLLAAATAALAEGSLLRPAEIAQRAGVGVGTFYRNFPDRDSLFEAVAQDRYEVLRAEAERLLGEPPSFGAIGQWLTAFSGYLAAFPALPEAVRHALVSRRSDPDSSCSRMLHTWDRLFGRAQREGLLRNDIDAREVLRAVNAIMSSIRETPPEPARGSAATSAARMTAVVIDGLRPPPE